jgi:hypothetical protein
VSTIDIRGYRELDEREIKLINEIKDLAEKVGFLVEQISCLNGVGRDQGAIWADQRWVHIARTDLQKGFMALTRAVAKPTSF